MRSIGASALGPATLLLASVIVLGCGYVSSPAGSGIPPTNVPASATPPATPSNDPRATASTPQATAPTPTDPTEPAPPAALLASGDVSVTGLVGSYCYGKACADGPAPAKEASPQLALVTDGEDLHFALAGGEAFVWWSATYAVESGDEAIELATSGERPDEDTRASPPAAMSTAEFAAPPPGDWIIAVTIDFADDLGDATYYWNATVP